MVRTFLNQPHCLHVHLCLSVFFFHTCDLSECGFCFSTSFCFIHCYLFISYLQNVRVNMSNDPSSLLPVFMLGSSLSLSGQEHSKCFNSCNVVTREFEISLCTLRKLLDVGYFEPKIYIEWQFALNLFCFFADIKIEYLP